MTGPLRILFITDAFPPTAYGSGLSTYHLARGLRAAGHAVRIVVAQPTARLCATTFDNFSVWQAGDDVRMINPALFALSGLGPGRIARSLVQEWKPDVVHAQHVNSALVAHRVAAGAPVIVTVRDHWPVCFYGTALADAPCPGCLHGTLSACNTKRGSVTAARPAAMLKATTMRAMLTQRRQILRSAAAVIAASDAIRDEVCAVIDRDTVRVIPNAVDQSLFAETDADAIPNLPVRFFLFAGKLSMHKGADLLPEIARRMGDDAPPLLIVGDGEEEAMLREADPMGTRIRVLGRVPNGAVIALMTRAIALVTPARWPEPLSRTHLEALATGCPIVATDTGGTREIVEHGVTGYLTDIDDVQSMARHLTALAGDNELRSRMAAASRTRSARLFSLDAVTKRHIAVYHQAIEQYAE
jgi:glycogen(starch) synthase